MPHQGVGYCACRALDRLRAAARGIARGRRSRRRQGRRCSPRYEHAHALALQLGDPCWEGLAARGLGMVAAHQGDAATALQWIAEARHRCVRLPDAYLWVEGYCLDALCALAVEQGRPEAARWIEDLEALGDSYRNARARRSRLRPPGQAR